MSLTLELPAALEAELTAESERLGVSVSDVVVGRIAAVSNRPQRDHRPENGKELVAYWRKHGVIGSRSDIADSTTFARSLRAEAEVRTRN